VYKDRIARLVYELEKRADNDESVKKLMAVNKRYLIEINDMQERMGDVYGLEDTVKRQEIVIEKLENLVHKLLAEKRNAGGYSHQQYDLIKSEMDGIKSNTTGFLAINRQRVATVRNVSKIRNDNF
jgi:hypothetical protein